MPNALACFRHMPILKTMTTTMMVRGTEYSVVSTGNAVCPVMLVGKRGAEYGLLRVRGTEEWSAMNGNFHRSQHNALRGVRFSIVDGVVSVIGG